MNRVSKHHDSLEKINKISKTTYYIDGVERTEQEELKHYKF